MNKVVALLALLICLQAVFPPPLVEQYHSGTLEVKDACNIFQLSSAANEAVNSEYYLSKILRRMNKLGDCYKPQFYNRAQHIALNIQQDPSIKNQGYEINVDINGITIKSSSYEGYVYGLETLSQLYKDGKIPFVTIKDEPLLEYRGIMIDISRHFLSVASIKRVIESMPLSKLNILHWHISDDESFPVKLGSHPELAKSGSYSEKETYTTDDFRELIALAEKNAVKIIPEIDTPAHVRAWGLSEQWKVKNITIKCPAGRGYDGQFDVSKGEAYNLTRDVVREVDELFRNSPYIHLGGDEVSEECWNLRPEIKTFMKLKNIKSYGQLQMYWRYQIRDVLPANRRVIYWRNDAENVTTSDEDIIHYWGYQSDVARYTANSKSKIILSPEDLLYLNKGHGNLWLNGSQGNYSVWKQIYEQFVVFPLGVDRNRILGAEVCLWGQVSNEDTLENNLWMRSSAFAARVWSDKIQQTYEVLGGLVQIQKTLYGMNVAASALTSEFCEAKPAVCFKPAKEEKVEVINSMK